MQQTRIMDGANAKYIIQRLIFLVFRSSKLPREIVEAFLFTKWHFIRKSCDAILEPA